MDLNHGRGSWMRDVMAPPPRTRLAHRAALAAPHARPPASTLRVLVVDDCEINRELASAQLLHYGIAPVFACDGAQAVERAMQETFDLVLMDMSMPVMDGLEATDRIRRFEHVHPERRRMAVVAFTSGHDADDPALLGRHRLDAVLHKPCDIRAVGDCLERVCGVSLG
jgi:CheY-like chemotaxis protein